MRSSRTSTMSRRFSVAPMMEWTDRHCRFFHRLLTRHALLYTEMVTTGAVIHGDRERLLGFTIRRSIRSRCSSAAPIRARWRECARIARGLRLRRDQPQRRLPVGPGAGGPLRRLPDGGAAAGRRLRRGHEGRGDGSGHGQVPHRHRRAGPEAALERFDARGEAARRRRIHRACAQGLAAGLSPKENREVPPLDYDRVYRLKAAHPDLAIVLNGGIGTLEQAAAHLPRRRRDAGPRRLSGAMAAVVGRSACCSARRRRLRSHGRRSRRSSPTWKRSCARGTRLHAITRHMLGLFQGMPGARAYRRHLATEAVKPGADAKVAALEALSAVSDPRPAACRIAAA